MGWIFLNYIRKMYSKKNSFSSLSNELELFINKYYNITSLRGLIMTAVFGLAVVIGVWGLESFFRFSSGVRASLFFGASSLVVLFFVKSSVVPFLKRHGVLSRISNENAAFLLAQKIPTLNDQLINVLGLQKQFKMNQSDLLAAAIEKKSFTSLKYDLLGAISFREHKKFLSYVILLFAVFTVCSIVFSEKILPPLKRVVLFQNEFSKPNPFSLLINSASDLVVLEGESLRIDIKTVGLTDPERLNLFVENQKFFPIKIKKNTFSHVFRSVKESFTFKILDGNLDTVIFSVRTLPKARILSEKKVVEYPKYTQLETDTFYDLNRLVVPEGSVVNWVVSSFNSSMSEVRFIDTTFFGEEVFSFTYTPSVPQSYSVYVQNIFSEYRDSSIYNIDIVKDQYPGISFKDVADSNRSTKHLFLGEISDDYGFSELTFCCAANDSLLKEVDIPFGKGSRSVFSFNFDFGDDQFKVGSLVEYYFKVKDNDGVNGPKETLSKKQFYRELNKEEKRALLKTKSNSQKKSFSSLEKKLYNLNSELDEIKNSMLNKKSLDWEDKANLNNFIKNHEKLQKELEQLKKQLTNDLSEKEKNKSDEILKKQEKINEMMEDLFSDEMKKLLDELSQLAKEMNKEKVLEKLEDVDFNQENMLKELDRTIEHFKNLEMEKLAKDISEDLMDLAKKQENLAKKTLDKKTSDFTKNKKQEEIKDEFNKIQDDLFNLKNKNNELVKPKKIDTEESEKNINESMEESLENLSENKMKKAKDQQDKSAENMKELSEAMSKLSSGGSQQAEEDLESLRVLLEQLISFSIDQESVLKDLKSTKVQDPNYIKIGQSQRRLNDEIQIIDDSLTALGLRQIMLSSKINKEVQSIRRSLTSSIKNLTERQTKNAQIEQQTVMMHTNELGLLLSEVMNQMQNQMPGSGQCNKPGGKNKKPGKGMPNSAEQMKKQIEAMKKFLEGKKSGKTPGKNKSSFEQLGRMAAQQAALKKQLKELSQDLNKDGSGKGNGLKDLIKKIEEVENEIINNDISLSSIKRQEEIKIKLLELDKASKNQEEKEERESKESDAVYKQNNSLLFEEYLKLKQSETEMLKTIPTNLKPYYKNKVNEYIKSIEKNYD